MKLRGWMIGVVVAGGSVMGMRGCLSKAPPDARLGSRFDDLCEIARDNVKTPEKGVRQLGGYLAKHLDDLFGEWGGTIATIEKIKDDDDHDARAREARERLLPPLKTCERDWARFAEAVEGDEKASELVQTASERFNRTIEIIFGPDDGAAHTRFELRGLPERLEHALEPR
jgi:hypothetical protein